MTGVPTLDWLLQAGPLGITLAGFALILRGQLVPKMFYDEKVSELQEFRANNREVLDLSRRLVTIIEEEQQSARARPRRRSAE